MGKVIKKSTILLPINVDFRKWAVVACDQFTSQIDYWEKLAEFVGDAPSTLKITYPEIYLNDNMDKRIADINKNMDAYLKSGIFEELDGFVLVEREVEGGKKRLSLVLSVDLETYDYRRVKTEIRATEDTIIERLPVRLKIRENAKIELPHIILLMDDDKKEIIEPIYKDKNKLRKLYDFDLNMDGGHIAGYLVSEVDEIVSKLNKLLDSDLQEKKYSSDAGILFAVGDGNHSMATAKEHWNRIKNSLTIEEQENHPARYALVEVMNIYDQALFFHPIHRVIFDYKESFIDGLKKELSGSGKLKLITKKGEIFIDCPNKSSETITKVQEYIERLRKEGSLDVDYVHGENYVEEIVHKTNALGIIMPEFAKSELFEYVVNVGNLPKKAFSIGTAENKKYYMEAKRI